MDIKDKLAVQKDKAWIQDSEGRKHDVTHLVRHVDIRHRAEVLQHLLDGLDEDILYAICASPPSRK